MATGLKNNTLFAIFRLVRLPNLLIVALTQYLLFYRILKPAINQYRLSPALSDGEFALLVVVTLIITAGGYIINDIIDFRIDVVNRPDKVIIEKVIPTPTAYWLYFLFNLVGFGFSLYLAMLVQPTALLFIYPLAVFGLYLYSTRFKKQQLIGNVLVSLYCAGVAGVVWFAERSVLHDLGVLDQGLVQRIQIFLGGYCFFAFLSTLLREIIKDVEDRIGDAEAGYQTFPIVHGTGKAKILALIPGVLLLGAIVLLGATFLADFSDPINIIVIAVVLILLIFTLVKLLLAKEKGDYYQLSQLTKIVMLSGILLLLFIKI